MEARRVLTFAFVAAACWGATGAYAYDDRATHPALTQEIVRAYNAVYPEDRIGDADMEALMRAGTEEDQLPRPLNHLYDPVHKTGWSGQKAGWVPSLVTKLGAILALLPDAPLASIEWINADAAQQAYARYGGNRSWQAGMRALAADDQQQALRSLGSALHLLEDAGVPEHARDDTHVHQISFLTGDAGSPYENYAARYDRSTIGVASRMRLGAADIPRYGDPADYVADNARYAAASFFSKDTIADAGFPQPQVTRESGGIAYGQTSDGKEVPLARRVSTVLGSTKLALGDDPAFATILEAQFRIMSERTVRLGVGMVRDFRLAKRERAEAAPAVRKIYSMGGEISNALSWLGGVASDAIRSGAGQASRAYAWLTGGRTATQASERMIGTAGSGTQDYEELATAGAAPKAKQDNVAKTSASSSKAVSQPRASSSVALRCPVAGAPRVRISEIAWMGTAASANDEWIELVNEENDALDLEGWELEADGGLYIDLSGVRVPAGGYVLLERTDDSSVPRVAAAAIYTGALPNAPADGFALRLKAPGCGPADSLTVEGGWPGGDAASRRTLERSASGTWQTSALPGGTPGLRNSSGFVVAKASTTKATSTAKGTTTQDVSDDGTAEEIEDEGAPIDQGAVRISEVQAAGASATDEFVELYNTEDRPVLLTGWSLQYFAATAGAIAQKRSLPEMRIPARGYFLVAREPTGAADGYAGGVRADFAHRTFSLSGAGARVALVRSDERVTSMADQRVADWVSYPALAAYASYERAAWSNGQCMDVRPGAPGELLGNGCSAQQWYERQRSEPQNTASAPEPRQGASSAETASSTGTTASTTSSTEDTWLVLQAPAYRPDEDGTDWSLFALWRGSSTPPAELSTASQLEPPGSALSMEYLACSGSRVVVRALLMPLTPAACQFGGGLSGGWAGPYWEDTRMVVRILTRLIPGELLQIARYAFVGGGGGQQRFALQESTVMPAEVGGAAPDAPGRLRADSGNGPRVRIDWNAAMDPDNVDASLVYEMRIGNAADTGAWDSLGAVRFAEKELMPGEYWIAVRARDEQGNVGEPAALTITIVAPAPAEQFVHDTAFGPGSGELSFTEGIRASGMNLWVAPEGGPFCCSDLSVELADASGSVIAQGTAGRRLTDGDGETFVSFGAVVQIPAGKYILSIRMSDPPRNAFKLLGKQGGNWQGGALYLRFAKE